MKSLVVISGLVITVGLCGCGGDSAASPRASSPISLPPEYCVLADQLALEMETSPEHFRDDEPLAEMIARWHSAILSLQGIKSDDPDITYIANQGVTALKQMVTRIECINALPKPPSAGVLLTESFVHGLFGNLTTGYALGVDAEEKQKALATECQALLAAADMLDATQLMLPNVANKYALGPADDASLFTVDINESWGWFAPHDWLGIYNAGAALSDCTIEILLFGARGESRKNVHFVRHWPTKSWMYARYEPGESVLDHKDVGRTTVSQIEKAGISICSPQFTTSVMYVYQGHERDKDIAQRCKDLKFTGRYQTFVPGLIFNTYRGVEFTLDGIGMIPKCRIDMTFRKDSQSQDWYWELDSWAQGEKKSFTPVTERLTFDPSIVDMKISFPNTSYTHNVTLNVD